MFMYLYKRAALSVRSVNRRRTMIHDLAMACLKFVQKTILFI